MEFLKRSFTRTFLLVLALVPGSGNGMGSPVMNHTDTPLMLVPAPRSWQPAAGRFVIGDLKRIVVQGGDRGLAAEAEHSARQLAGFLDRIVPLQVSGPGAPPEGSLVFRVDPRMAPEEYALGIAPDRLELSAAGAPGFRHGTTTLIQLILAAPDPATLPAGVIRDEPRFAWRGLLLDCGRHFMPVAKIKEVLDRLALYKFNVLHWHLTEDQGWRLEVPGYPRLTKVGAWRTSADGSRYGGFYTDDEVREILAYAAARSITVVPEIEMPGHCQAALAAYPELSCTGGPFAVQTQWGIHQDVFCAGREETFAFLEDVLTRVMDLFPGPYIHVGGDEVPKDRWRVCPRCQARIREEGLTGEDDLQSWFTARIATFLAGNGHRLIGWDEILTGGLPGDPGNYSVQAWRGLDQAAAGARAGHEVIVSPTSHAYFDQDPGFLDIQKVFGFRPVPAGLTEDEAGLVLGGQMNLWTEYIPPERVDRMLFPRLAAMAEALWTGAENREFPDFLHRLEGQKAVWKRMGIEPGAAARPLVFTGGYDVVSGSHRLEILLDPRVAEALPEGILAVSHEILGIPFAGNFDPAKMPEDQALPPAGRPSSQLPEFLEIPGGQPDGSSRLILAQLFADGETYGAPALLEVSAHAALGAPLTLVHEPDPRYPGGGPAGLVNGLRGSRYFQDGLWSGFEGHDLDATLDLGPERECRGLAMRFLQDANAWIFLPGEVRVFVSNDGMVWRPAGTAGHRVPDKVQEKVIHEFRVELPPGPIRFVRVLAINSGPCPDWHPGRGQATWIFADEIVVR